MGKIYLLSCDSMEKNVTLKNNNQDGYTRSEGEKKSKYNVFVSNREKRD